MPLLIYLLQVNAALVLFFLVYHLLLRRLTFFTLNRFFLLLGIICSAWYPVIDLKQFTYQKTFLDSSIHIPLNMELVHFISQPTHTWEGWPFILYVFWMGFAIMSLRLALQLGSLYLIHRKSKRAAYQKYPYRQVNEDINPFSFWQSIYLNPAKHTSKELEIILQHEQIHVEQWHIADILLAELTTIVCWCNPVAWLMKGAIKENLEFIADRETIKRMADYKSYQYLLLHLSSPKRALTINFTTLALRKRIVMMNKTPSSIKLISAYFVLIPVFMLCYVVSQLSEVLTPASMATDEKSDKIASLTLTQLFSNREKSVLLSIDTIPGTAAHIRKLYNKTKANDIILFLVDGQGRAIDMQVKMEGSKIVEMKLLSIAPPDYKPAQEFVKTFKMEK